MKRSLLLSGLLIVLLILGFSACKNSLLDDEEDSEILFLSGRWEFVITFGSTEYRIKGTVVASEMAGPVESSYSKVTDLTVNDAEVVPAVGLDQNLLIFIKKIGDKDHVVTGRFGFIDKQNRRFEILLDGQHTGTRASGQSTIEINEDLDTIDVGTFTARKI